ncbi:hypothetical protein ACFPYI_05690 [Halomarina salina]|uniref:DUF1049 domain-containing protein n=1 Tax=Halomarina salina TaxID=1872699 RepID=A0ABD5RK38_9EURY|nr:hypothetical protein [Halomarina salina]
MADTTSKRRSSDRERLAQEDSSSSLGSSLALRAAGFIVLMFVIGFFIDWLASNGVVDDSEMMNVIIAIFLSLGLIGILLSVVVGVAALVRRIRR